MNRLHWYALAALVAALFALQSNAPAQDGSDAASKEALEAAVARVKPSLVRIKVVEPYYYDGRESKSISFGSGTIVTPEGHIVTNHHVAGKAVRLMCTMPNREVIPAELIGTDAATDIAVIKLLPESPTVFSYVEYGDSDAVRVGDPVLAMGSPLSLSQSVTLGIVSNTAMIMPELMGNSEMELDGENVGELVRWFAHDAAIYGGNSGGPLVNFKGEIIGVNELSLGLAGAIPGNLARRVAEDLIRYGYVRRSWAGLSLQPRLAGAGTDSGALVASVVTGSPAHDAGIKPGDLLTAINSTTVSVKFGEDLPEVNNIIADLPVGEKATFTVLRDGADLALELTPVQRQPAYRPSEEFREWGITASDLNVWLRLRLARNEAAGAYVTSVGGGSPVAQAKPEIRQGDIIVRVNETPISTLADLRAATASVLEGATEPVAVLVTYEREDEQLVTVAKIGISEIDDPSRDVRKAWLPVETQVVTREIARQIGDASLKGVRVTRVYRDVPEDFPIQVGDILTALDGEPIEAAQPHDSQVFDTMVRQYRIGSECEISVVRGGEKKSVVATLGESPAKVREMRRFRDLDFEFVVREAAHNDRQRRHFEGVPVSLLVDSVSSGGWADLAGLRVGDVILAISGEEVGTIEALEALMDRIRTGQQETVVVFVRRGTSNLFVEIEPEWKEMPPFSVLGE